MFDWRSSDSRKVNVQKEMLMLRDSRLIAILARASALSTCVAQPSLLGICLGAAWQAKPLITAATKRCLSLGQQDRIHHLQGGTMNTRKLWSVALSIVIGCLVLLPFAYASDENEQVTVTFTNPVEIPGRVLPAGTYIFVLVGDPFSRDDVRIYSADRKTVYATLGTVETQRPHPANGVTVTFAERESSTPEALLSWFYPGRSIGHEFLYPKREQKELAQDNQQVIVAAPMETQAHIGF
jgi:hypothetical protein